MSSSNRTSCIAIMLAIIVSNMTFNVHVVSHVVDQQGGCEMCAGHGDPSHAIAVSILATLAPLKFTPTEVSRPVVEAIDSIAAYRPRGPPAVI